MRVEYRVAMPLQALNDESLLLLASDLQEHGLAILAGAGASLAPPACAPLFRPLRDGLLKALNDSLAETLHAAVLERVGRLFSTGNQQLRSVEPVPEVLFEALHGIHKDGIFDILRILLAVSAPNSHHRFVANLASHGLRLLITTNFEDGFEQAFREAGYAFDVSADGPAISRSLASVGAPGFPFPIWKVHGTLEPGAEESIRITLSQIARESVDPRKFEPVVSATVDLPLLVVGYSGYDRDLSRVLIRAGERGRRLYWLSLHEPDADAPVRRILHAWNDRGRLMVGDLSDLCSSLSSCVTGLRPYERPAGECGDRLTDRFSALAERIATVDIDTRLASLASLCSQLADFDSALAVLTTLEERAVRARSGEWVLFCVMLRTSILRTAGRAPELGPALQRLQGLRGAMGPVGDPKLLDIDAVLLHEIAGYFRMIGQLGHAEDAFGKALAVARLAGDAELVATISQSFAAMLSHLRKPKEARPLLEAAAASSSASGNRVAELKARHELAILAIEQKRLDDASAALTESVAGAREIGASDIETAALFELGLIALRTGRHDEAYQLFSDVRRLAALIGTRSTELKALLYLGDVEQERKQYEASVLTLNTCAEAAAEHGDGAVEATALSRRARSYYVLGDKERARADLNKARPLADRWFPALRAEIDALLDHLGD